MTVVGTCSKGQAKQHLLMIVESSQSSKQLAIHQTEGSQSFPHLRERSPTAVGERVPTLHCNMSVRHLV